MKSTVLFSDDVIWGFIQEDTPYFDLTTSVLEIGDRLGKISFSTRHETVLCCTEEVATMLRKVGADVTLMLDTGEKVEKGVTFLEATGKVGALQIGWKPSQNLLEYSCGVATKTNQLVGLAKQSNDSVMLCTTRKTIPGTKPVAIKAILAGGGFPHRLGLSETVLIFPQHLNFVGGIQGLIEKLPTIKPNLKEKKIVVEVKTIADAWELVSAGVDGIQFDKITATDLEVAVPKLKAINNNIMILAAGGINESNIIDYAATGVDVLVSSSPYNSKPADIGVKIEPCRVG